ncbi:MAG: bifunctional YncE family protein/alkaline phosphatase family protein [Vulcanimicrobiaceae bacterium]
MLVSGISLPASAFITVGGPPQGPALVPTGLVITATKAPGSTFQRLTTGLRADGTADGAEAVNSALSPDGKTLLVLTSGYNLGFSTESGTPIAWPVLDPKTGLPTATLTSKAEWVFVFDVTGATPTKIQEINIPDTYVGLVWDPSGGRFYVSGGGDDRVYAFKKSGGKYVADAPFVLLGHDDLSTTSPIPTPDGGILKGTPAGLAAPALVTGAMVAGLGISKGGSQLFVANLSNDSMSYIDTATRKVVGETHFTLPGSGLARGEYPYDIAVKSDSAGKAEKVFVSSQRDAQIVVVSAKKGITNVIPVGDGPNKLLLTHDQRVLWVSNGNTDSLTAIDTRSETVIGSVTLHRPGFPYYGSNPNWLALSPDGKTLYVTLGGENAVAVVNAQTGAVLGRIPTGWQPNSVSISLDGKRLWVVNAKAPAGPNPGNADARNTAAGLATNTTAKNEYGWALEKAGLLQIPLPIGPSELADLSYQVDKNDGFFHHSDPLAYLRGKIKHVIYIVNENRTYDQVLGDLPGTNADPALNLFPYKVSPNHHRFAMDFATLDNFYDPGESSGVGWNWSMEGFDTDFVERNQSVDYGNGGDRNMTYDYQGTNRNLNVALPISGAPANQYGERLTTVLDPTGKSTILPGTKDIGAPYNANNEYPAAIGGYIFDSALRAGLTVRNYGWQIDQTAYSLPPTSPLYPALVRHPYENHVLQSPPQDAALNANTDEYYRGFDQAYPDLFRIEEWTREFNNYVANKNLPNLETLTVPHDHFGSFGTAIEGLVTPSREFADNDYALAQLVSAVSHSPYWDSTAIFIVEDDSQNGPDHVDSHRSTAFVISPYVHRGVISHTPYTTENVLATIESLLGIRPLSFHDANALPMADIFTPARDVSAYDPYVPGILCGKPDDAPPNPTLPPVPSTPVSTDLLGASADPTACSGPRVTAGVTELHDGAWWTQHSVGFDFSRPDAVDSDAFNQLLYLGIKGEGTSVASSTARN